MPQSVPFAAVGPSPSWRRGWSTLQLLFIFPLLLVFTFAFIEFALVLQVEQTISAAAEFGARVASRGGTDTEVLDAVNQVLALHNLLITPTTTDANVLIEDSSGSSTMITAVPCASPGPALPMAPAEHRVTVCVALRPDGADSVWQGGLLPDLLTGWGVVLYGQTYTASALAPTE